MTGECTTRLVALIDFISMSESEVSSLSTADVEKDLETSEAFYRVRKNISTKGDFIWIADYCIADSDVSLGTGYGATQDQAQLDAFRHFKVTTKTIMAEQTGQAPWKKADD